MPRKKKCGCQGCNEMAVHTETVKFKDIEYEEYYCQGCYKILKDFQNNFEELIDMSNIFRKEN